MELKNIIIGRVLRVVKMFYTPVSLVFILYFSWINRELLLKLAAVANGQLVLVAVVLWAFLHLLSPLSPKIILASLGFSISYSKLLEIHISRLPARYLPGGIWHTVGRLSAYHSYGVSKKQLTFLALVETLFPGFIPLFVGGSFLWWTGGKQISSSVEGMLSLISIVSLFVIPFIVRWKLPSIWSAKFVYYYLGFIMLSLLFWIIASFSFVSYYSSMSLGDIQLSFLRMAAIYMYSWGIGYVSIFAPQGIGVFEVVAGHLMALPMALGGAVAFLAGFRIVALLADGLVFASFRMVLLFMKTRSAESGS